VFGGAKSFAWFRVVLPDAAAAGRALHFTMVDDEGVVWLNGARLVEHFGWGDPFTVALDKAWKPAGPNVLTVLVGNSGGGPGRIGAAALVVGPVRMTVPEAAATGFRDTAWRRVD